MIEWKMLLNTMKFSYIPVCVCVFAGGTELPSSFMAPESTTRASTYGERTVIVKILRVLGLQKVLPLFRAVTRKTLSEFESFWSKLNGFNFRIE